MALLAVAASLNCCGMIDAAIKALSQMFAPTLRHVLLKAAGLALVGGAFGIAALLLGWRMMRRKPRP